MRTAPRTGFSALRNCSRSCGVTTYSSTSRAAGSAAGPAATTAHTVLPGAPCRSATPHSSASAATRASPRPPSVSGPPSAAGTGSRSPRTSLTSTRTRAPSAFLLSRSSASRPGTRPWVTALAASSATTSSTVSCTGLP